MTTTLWLECVYDCDHACFWEAAVNVTSAPSLSLLAVTWSLQWSWMWLHREHAVFWLPQYAVCASGGAVLQVVSLVWITFFFFPSPFIIHRACILQFSCLLIQQHVFVSCPLLTHLNKFHWCFVPMCRSLSWACSGSLGLLLYISPLNLLSVVSRRVE